VKRLFSIFLLITYLFSATVFGELLKIPILIDHYKEHKAANVDMDIFDFFYLHYASKKNIDADYQKDLKLPFKSNSESTMQLYSCIEPYTVLLINNIYYIDKITPKAFYQNFHTNYYFGGIWQPPRTC
jgi:hypothetical protein